MLTLLYRGQNCSGCRSKKKIIIWNQIDNAGGHAIKNSLDIINYAGFDCGDPRIRVLFYCQHPNSPDFNTLDLGAWTSLQTKVASLLYQPSTSILSMADQVIERVEKSFSEWNTRDICSKLWKSRKAAMVETIKHHGSNTFKQPHTKGLQQHIHDLRPRMIPFNTPPPSPQDPSTPVAIEIPCQIVTLAQSPITISSFVIFNQ